MSRSPETSDGAPGALRAYEDSWEAIYNLIDEGAGWSGGERNCAFLNTRSLRFAGVSAASGLDFPDDGRALATTDWDFDGRLDFWVANRTAPRLRLLRNVTPTAGHHVVFHLRGTSANRDAIGARVVVTPGSGPPILRTLRAGEGYLAQSGKAVHFGLGEDAAIAQVVVHWPGGEPETFHGVHADAAWDLVQGAGAATRRSPPTGVTAPGAGSLEIPSRSPSTRTWIAGRVLFPAEQFAAWDGSSRPLSAFGGRPLLINLWSHSCAPCLAELAEWNARASSLEESGIAILALCVDEGDAERRAAAAHAANLRFATGVAPEELALALETVSHAFLESRRPLPVPTSILLDRSGLVAALYKGPVSMDRLVADSALLDAPAEAQRAAAVPFPGRWLTPPLAPNPRLIIGTLMKAGRSEAARAYTLRCLDPSSPLRLPSPTAASLTLFLGDLDLDAGLLDPAAEAYSRLFALAPRDPAIHREAALRLVTKQRVADALPHLEKAVELDPDHADARLNLASILLHAGRIDAALAHLRELARQRPDSAALQLHLGRVLRAQGRDPEALRHFETAHALEPGGGATVALAWILAAHPDAALRDGPRAVELAEAAVRGPAAADPFTFEAAAAAYAESGRFEDAVRAAEQALARAVAAGGREAVARAERHLEVVRSGHPIRE